MAHYVAARTVISDQVCKARVPLYRFQTDASPTDLHTIIAAHDLPSLDAAKRESIRYLGELLEDDGPEFWTQASAVGSVLDEDGGVIFTLRLPLV